MTKFVITDFTIPLFRKPEFASAEEAEAWISAYVDRLARIDNIRRIGWDEVDWKVEETE